MAKFKKFWKINIENIDKANNMFDFFLFLLGSITKILPGK